VAPNRVPGSAAPRPDIEGSAEQGSYESPGQPVPPIRHVGGTWEQVPGQAQGQRRGQLRGTTRPDDRGPYRYGNSRGQMSSPTSASSSRSRVTTGRPAPGSPGPRATSSGISARAPVPAWADVDTSAQAGQETRPGDAVRGPVDVAAPQGDGWSRRGGGWRMLSEPTRWPVVRPQRHVERARAPPAGRQRWRRECQCRQGRVQPGCRRTAPGWSTRSPASRGRRAAWPRRCWRRCSGWCGSTTCTCRWPSRASTSGSAAFWTARAAWRTSNRSACAGRAGRSGSVTCHSVVGAALVG
jgi:hypothetical protein